MEKIENSFAENQKRKKLNKLPYPLCIIQNVRVSVFSSQKISQQDDEFDNKYGFMLKYGITDSINYQDVKNYYQSLSTQSRIEKGF